MSALDLFPKSNPDNTKSDAFRIMYELAKSQGDKRFGSECKHEVTNQGRCVNCLRRVVTKKATGGNG